jgi:hypothetical protein
VDRRRHRLPHPERVSSVLAAFLSGPVRHKFREIVQKYPMAKKEQY